MDFALGEEQRMLQDSIAGYLESGCPLVAGARGGGGWRVAGRRRLAGTHQLRCPRGSHRRGLRRRGLGLPGGRADRGGSRCSRRTGTLRGVGDHGTGCACRGRQRQPEGDVVAANRGGRGRCRRGLERTDRPARVRRRDGIRRQASRQGHVRDGCGKRRRADHRLRRWRLAPRRSRCQRRQAREAQDHRPHAHGHGDHLGPGRGRSAARLRHQPRTAPDDHRRGPHHPRRRHPRCRPGHGGQGHRIRQGAAPIQPGDRLVPGRQAHVRRNGG